ncbi:MAG: EamA family transporter [bacterium]
MKKAYPICLALLSAALFGALTPASKVLLTGLTAFQLAGLLYLGGAIGVMPALFRGRRSRALTRIDRKNALRLGGAILFGGIVGPVLLLAGLRLASAASVSLWLNLELAATALLGYFVFREHLGLSSWLAVVSVMVAGSLLSIGEGPAGIAAGLLVAAACLCWGMDNHLSALIDGLTPAESTFYKSCIAGTVNLAIGLAMTPLEATLTTGGIALLVGALAVGTSITLDIAAAQMIGATRGQLFFATAPFFGVLGSALFLGESLTLWHGLATVLIAMALFLLTREKHLHAHVHQYLEHEHLHRHDDLHHTHPHHGIPASTRHSHYHRHEPTGHSHPHWPDLHHRHRHDNSDSKTAKD